MLQLNISLSKCVASISQPVTSQIWMSLQEVYWTKKQESTPCMGVGQTVCHILVKLDCFPKFLSLLVYNWNARQVRGNPNHALSPITHDNMMTPLFSILLGYIFQLSSTAKKKTKKTNTTERAQNALQATLNTGNNNLCIAVDQRLLWFWDCGSHQYRKLWAASRQASPLVEAEPKPRGGWGKKSIISLCAGAERNLSKWFTITCLPSHNPSWVFLVIKERAGVTETQEREADRRESHHQGWVGGWVGGWERVRDCCCPHEERKWKEPFESGRVIPMHHTQWSTLLRLICVLWHTGWNRYNHRWPPAANHISIREWTTVNKSDSNMIIPELIHLPKYWFVY